MIDPDSRHGRDLKAAEEFFALAKTAPTPFMRSYYQRVAERYLSSKGELRTAATLSESLLEDTARQLADQSEESEAVNMVSVLSQIRRLNHDH
jgi:hypothetical protein